MYRDDPLADEEELRAVIGDDPVDDLVGSAATREIDPRDEHHPVAAALDALHILQGWVDDAEAASWFVTDQQRLDGRTPLVALASGDADEVRDAARRWAAAQG